nr:hypothetical protein [Haloprofundus halobius]
MFFDELSEDVRDVHVREQTCLPRSVVVALFVFGEYRREVLNELPGVFVSPFDVLKELLFDCLTVLVGCHVNRERRTLGNDLLEKLPNLVERLWGCVPPVSRIEIDEHLLSSHCRRDTEFAALLLCLFDHLANRRRRIRTPRFVRIGCFETLKDIVVVSAEFAEEFVTDHRELLTVLDFEVRW